MDEHVIWLVRHAESTANAGEPTRDYATIPLSPLGWLQAKSFIPRVPRRPERIVVSGYLRSQQTAAPLIAHYPEVPVEQLDVHEFSYLHFSGDRAITWQERVPLVEAYWQRLDPWHRENGAGESYAILVERVRNFLNVARTWSGLNIVFSHEHFIRAVALAVLTRSLAPTPESMKAFSLWRSGWRVPNVAIFRLAHHNDRWWIGGAETT